MICVWIQEPQVRFLQAFQNHLLSSAKKTSSVVILSKFHKWVGSNKQVGWKFANPVGWKKCKFIWAYSFMKFAQNYHPTRLFGHLFCFLSDFSAIHGVKNLSKCAYVIYEWSPMYWHSFEFRQHRPAVCALGYLCCNF